MTGERKMFMKKEGFEYPIIDAKRTGAWLRCICKYKKLTVKDLQRNLHIASNQAIYDWFNGKTLPSLNNMYALSRLVNVPIEQMLLGEGQKLSVFDLYFIVTNSNMKRLLEYARRLHVCAELI